MEPGVMIKTWRATLQGPHKSWILFRNGSCVVLTDPKGDLAEQATLLLQEWGPVHVGSPSGDFNVWTLENDLGWVVSGHHKDILNLVGRDEVDPGASDLTVGLLGRSRRAADAEAPQVVHVEDRRPA